MSKRSLAREQTRSRIVEATVKLHGENGVFGTSWQQIADEADVSVATVYAHFPSLDDLLPACGALVMERIRPPSPDSASSIVGDAHSLDQRLGNVAAALFSFYERGGSLIEVDVRERQLPAMREWEDYLLDLVSELVREALANEGADAEKMQLVSALFDLATFKAFRERGIESDLAARTVARLANSLVREGQAPPQGLDGTRKRTRSGRRDDTAEH